jgi:hypothetical protein
MGAPFHEIKFLISPFIVKGHKLVSLAILRETHIKVFFSGNKSPYEMVNN